jgi:hypothetical protein
LRIKEIEERGGPLADAPQLRPDHDRARDGLGGKVRLEFEKDACGPI